MKIHKLFETVIGQLKVKELLSMFFAALENGKEISPMLITGQSGLGKTLLLDIVQAIYEGLGWLVIRVNCPSEIVGEKYALICQTMRENLAPVCLMVDEAHRLKKGRVSVQRMRNFIQLATDERMKGKQISINDGEISVPCLDWNKLTFVLATNFASELEEARGSTSFVQRFCGAALEDYSRKQSDEILHLMIARKGLRVADSTRGLIASCARGNARPLQNITDKLEKMSSALGDKHSLNRENILDAIRLSDLFPAGLDRTEIDILKAVLKRPVRQNILATQFPNVDGKTLRNSMAYLQREDKDLIRMTTKGYHITPDGEKYLRDCQKAGFKVWETAD